MERTDDRRSATANEARLTPAGAAPAETRDGSPPPQAEGTAHPDHPAVDPATNPSSASSPPASRAPSHPWRKGLLWAGAVVGLAVGGYCTRMANDTRSPRP